jgi:hypothetical protein
VSRLHGEMLRIFCWACWNRHAAQHFLRLSAPAEATRRRFTGSFCAPRISARSLTHSRRLIYSRAIGLSSSHTGSEHFIAVVCVCVCFSLHDPTPRSPPPPPPPPHQRFHLPSTPPFLLVD